MALDFIKNVLDDLKTIGAIKVEDNSDLQAVTNVGADVGTKLLAVLNSAPIIPAPTTANLKKIIDELHPATATTFQNTMTYNNTTIKIVPTFEELEAGLAYAFHSKELLSKVSGSTKPTDEELTARHIIDPSMSVKKVNDIMKIAYVAAKITDSEKETMKETWNANRVKICDVLSKNPNTNKSEIDEDHLVRSPVQSFARVNENIPLVRTQQDAARMRYGIMAIRPKETVSVSLIRKALSGGSNNAHAPLYPSVVMNGGAHPLATFEGGDIQAKIVAPQTKYLIESFKKLVGPNGESIAKGITDQQDKIVSGSKDLYTAIDNMKNITLGLRSNNLGKGIDATNLTTSDFTELARIGAEINKKSEKLARHVNKWDDIIELLQKLVDDKKVYGSA